MADNGKSDNDGDISSEDCVFKIKCRPCEEVGEINEGIGLCTDCSEYLCRSCFDVHTLPKPCRTHQLLDRDEVNELEGPLDKKCPNHKEELIKFYCILHEELCCLSCLNMNHHSCNEMHYIPDHARYLSCCQDYQRFENQLKTLVQTSKEVLETSKRNAGELEDSHTEALSRVKKARKMFNEEFDKVEAEIVEKAEEMKSEGKKQLETMNIKYKAAHEEVQVVQSKIETLKNTNQNANLYTEFLQLRGKLFGALAHQIYLAKQENMNFKCKIQFQLNKDTLAELKNPETFGTISQSSVGTTDT